jgi:hypothetical protein
VDSRTGVTEQGGICTHHLADLVVMLTAANDLSMEGTLWMAQALSDSRLIKMRGGRSLKVLPVATRIEQTAQKTELADFRTRFLKEFGALIEESVGEAEKFALASEIPYIPFYSFYERVAAREGEDGRDKRLYDAYETLAKGIIRYGHAAGLLAEATPIGRVVGPRGLGENAGPESADDRERFLEELKLAISSGDHHRVKLLADKLVSRVEALQVYPERDAVRILKMLRRESYFDIVSIIADCFVRAGLESAAIRRAYVQALIDQGDFSSALITLQTLLAGARRGSPEYLELRRLTGRVHKSLYIQAPVTSSSARRSRDLQQALNAYYEVYATDRQRLYDGVNCVALLARAQRDRMEVEGFPPVDKLATEILDEVKRSEAHDRLAVWDYSIAAEACLGLARYEEALRWVSRYVGSEDADAFEMQSQLNQFTAVWTLDRTQPLLGVMLELIESQLLSRGVPVPAHVPSRLESRDQLLKAIGESQFQRWMWFRTGMECAESIVRVELPQERSIGSGIIVRGSDLHKGLGGEGVLVTAAHVLAPPLSDRPGQGPSVTLELGQERRRVREIVWSSPALDITIARLEPRTAPPSRCRIGATEPTK